jgi:molybdopterin-guanine dinucleotide biosynthesis protein A
MMPAVERPGSATGATAIVLAGGRSSRMGTPKALLPFDGEPLVAHVVTTLGRLFPEVVVVAAPGQTLPAMPVRLVRDEVEHQGPVAGIYYGLRAARGDVGFVASCDSAFLNVDLISHLVSEAPGNDVVVPHWQDRYQPLHAVYRRSVLPLLAEQLARGELRPVHLFDRVRTRRVDEEEIRRFDPDGSSFFNMNTPADYAEALRRWSQAPGRAPGSPAPIQCTVELLGAARFFAKTREVSLTLPAGATFSQVYGALADKLPVLVGQVIDPDRARLIDGFACNVNGLDFVRAPTTTVNAGDNIVTLSADAGG